MSWRPRVFDRRVQRRTGDVLNGPRPAPHSRDRGAMVTPRVLAATAALLLLAQVAAVYGRDAGECPHNPCVNSAIASDGGPSEQTGRFRVRRPHGHGRGKKSVRNRGISDYVTRVSPEPLSSYTPFPGDRIHVVFVITGPLGISSTAGLPANFFDRRLCTVHGRFSVYGHIAVGAVDGAAAPQKIASVHANHDRFDFDTWWKTFLKTDR